MDTLILIGGLLVGYLIYSKGINDGIKLEKGHKVTIIPNPIKKVQEHKKEAQNDKAEEEKIASIENMMSYEGFKQKAGD